MLYKKSKFIHFLLFFYLFSSYLGATHIHNDGHASQDDCQVCLVVKNLHSADAPTADTLSTLENSSQEDISFIQNICLFTLYKGYDSHAPPLFS